VVSTAMLPSALLLCRVQRSTNTTKQGRRSDGHTHPAADANPCCPVLAPAWSIC
jgi:hypothetical protein